MIVRQLRNANTYVIGKDHIKKGTVCQDRTRFEILNGCYAISLSDGAGSRKLSHFGAEITTKVACSYFSKEFESMWDLFIKEEENAEAIIEEKKRFSDYLTLQLENYISSNPGSKIDDLLCTMEFVIIKNDRYIAGHCGDGVIGILKDEDGGEKLNVLSAPENGDASNITFFVNDKDSYKKIRFYHGSMTNVEGFILMSDGPEEALYDKNKGFNSNALVFFKAVRGVTNEESNKYFEKFLSEKVSKISYDDLSLNVLVYDEFDLDYDNEDIEDDFFNGIYPNQIAQESGYYISINTSIKGEGTPMYGYDAVEYLREEDD